MFYLGKTQIGKALVTMLLAGTALGLCCGCDGMIDGADADFATNPNIEYSNETKQAVRSGHTMPKAKGKAGRSRKKSAENGKNGEAAKPDAGGRAGNSDGAASGSGSGSGGKDKNGG